jgi:uncharacterized protein YodC (DUF2158 family)
MSSLDDVVTMAEVCALWGKSRSAVRYHVDRGVFKSRWAGGVLLIDRSSVVAVWGEPEQFGDALSVQDVCRLWRRGPMEVVEMAKAGFFKSRWADGALQIERASVLAVWGDPGLPREEQDRRYLAWLVAPLSEGVDGR